jgi:hypothetical protein
LLPTLAPGEQLSPSAAGTVYLSRSGTTAEFASADRLTITQDQGIEDATYVVPSPTESRPTSNSRQPQSGAAELQGSVTADESERAIGAAIVRATSIQTGGSYDAVTDFNGEFVIQVPAGQYIVDASAPLRQQLKLGQRSPSDVPAPITVAAAERVAHLNLRLPRLGVIDGVVIDELGQPVGGVGVQLLQPGFEASRRRLLPATADSMYITTDDRGEFRLYGIAPGRYYLWVASGALARGSETGGYVPTVFPDSGTGTERPIEIAAGQERNGLVITVRSGPTSIVRGSILDNGQVLRTGSVRLMPRDSLREEPFFLTGAAPRRADGIFELVDLPPGHYTLQAFGAGPLTDSSFGVTPLDLPDGASTALMIETHRGAIVAGSVAFDASDQRLKPAAAAVHITPTAVEFDSTPMGVRPSGTINDDGKFVINNVAGIRVIRAQAPAPWVLQEVTLGGQDITDRAIDYSTLKNVNLSLTLTANVGAISGAVGDRGKAVGDYVVLVFPVDRSKRIFPSRFLARTRADQHGAYIVTRLLPTNYLVVALRNVDDDAWQDPSFLQALEPYASTVTVHANATALLPLALTSDK